MKVTITLDKPKMYVVIEGSDSSLAEISDVVEQTFVKMKKVWLDTIKRQMKLPEKET